MDWMTRQDIDRILDHLSADDLIEAMVPGEAASAAMPMRAFNRAALRLGAATEDAPASSRVKASDFQYLVKSIGEVINVDSPLPASTAALLDSAVSGG